MWIYLVSFLVWSNNLSLPNKDLKLQEASFSVCSGSSWQPLILNFGRPILDWSPTNPESRFNVLFITVQASSPGLDEIHARRHISSQDLECLFRGKVDGQGVNLSAGESKFELVTDLVAGSFLAEGDDLYSPFQGKGYVEVYGLMQTPGLPDAPLSLRQDFRFSWPGAKSTVMPK